MCLGFDAVIFVVFVQRFQLSEIQWHSQRQECGCSKKYPTQWAGSLESTAYGEQADSTLEKQTKYYRFVCVLQDNFAALILTFDIQSSNSQLEVSLLQSIKYKRKDCETKWMLPKSFGTMLKFTL